MKIYIMCDLEGTAGVIDHRKQCWFDGEYYRQARQLATLELNALVQGALEGGARKIGEIRPFYLEPPYTIRTQFKETQHAERAAKQPGMLQTDAFTIELRDQQHIELAF
jgi:D-aminopeptidase